ncbi:9662_t:CDS:2 [Ambispora gerdemannii]|uniref:9662_t:CDS:1 n=1 Tax=Ambispora gerdemannii TaxID=144530 RepID=A0A9N9B5G9_9GLOM|nr:9662_t:CDS:2 [Ambispora gerdemannii]
MGGGDLNMKKSWHPLLIKNQERVWKEEQKAAEEQKKLEQLRKEKEEERQLQELRRLQEEAGGRKGIERLEWMYAAGPNQSSSGRAQEMEEYLLGKKRVDSLITQGNTVSQLSNQSTDIFISAMNPNANTYRDTQSKIREDPLLAIKKMEQDTIKSIVTNPIKMKELKQRHRSEDRSHNHLDRSRKRHHDRERSKSPYSNDHRRNSGSLPRKRERRDEYKSSENNRSDNNTRSGYHHHVDRRYTSIDPISSLPPRRREYDSYKSSLAPPRDGEKSQLKCEDENRKNGNNKDPAAQKRLQQMMDDAKKLADERKIRVAELERAESDEEKRVKEHMAKIKQEGGHSEHLRKLYKQAISSPQALDLGGQVRKSRNMLQKNIGDE